MFKNLIRLRLLDFFELTAAIGAALYVYQTGPWRTFEKPWVITALAISAIIIWIATRLGKASPTPGIFLATYTGALYGLTGLSPWMAIFGRAAVIETILSFYSPNVKLGSLQERCISAALVVGFMAIPATLFGATWLSIWRLTLLLRKKHERPKSKMAMVFAVVQFCLAILFIAGGGYYLVRPQIRHVRTIRIPYAYAKTTNLEIHAEPFDEAPCICAWSPSSTNDALYVLKSSKEVLRFNLTNGQLFSSLKLKGPEFRSKRQYSGVQPNRKRLGLTDGGHQRFIWWSIVKMADFPVKENKYQLLVWSFPKIELYDGDTGTDRSAEIQVLIESGHVWSVSPNRRFAVIQGSDTETKNFGQVVLDLSDLSIFSKSKHVPSSPMLGVPGFHLEFDVNNAGEIAVKSRTTYFGWAFDSKDEIDLAFCRPSFHDCDLSISTDSKWRLSSGGLTPMNDEANLLGPYMDYNLHAEMDHSTGKVVLLHNSSELAPVFDPEPIPPILFSLLERCNRDQLTLFDPATKTAATSWLPAGLFKTPESAATKFTPNGRHLVIQDEDASADLFHIFAMP